MLARLNKVSYSSQSSMCRALILLLNIVKPVKA
jgi:hypothetical protein